MRLIVALRLEKEGQAQTFIESAAASGLPHGQLINWHIDRRLPALRNIIEFFRANGALPAFRSISVGRMTGGKAAKVTVPDCRLYWCEIETELPPEHWASSPEVELVLVKEHFDTFLHSIRSRAGTAYIDACEDFARQLALDEAGTLGTAASLRGCEQAA